MIDVSDLFDAFHAIASSIWRDFGASVDDESWDDIIDSLEHDLFLAGCAHRLNAETTESLEPDEVPARIRLISRDSEIVGAGGQYHSHAFYPDDVTHSVPNAVMTGNLMARMRPEVSLVVTPKGAKPKTRRTQLPQL